MKRNGLGMRRAAAVVALLGTVATPAWSWQEEPLGDISISDPYL